MAEVTPAAESVTLVTQTRVLPDKEAAFLAWQQHVTAAVSAFPGFLDHTVTEPAPPVQFDWVIVQRFRSVENAQAWLQSPERQKLLAEIQPVLVGSDDIHLFTGQADDSPDNTVAAVISTSVAPGREQDYRAWQRRIAVAEAKFPGFRGVKLEPPVRGVQDDWVSIVRFDSDEHMQAWLTSPERQRLIDEATGITTDSRIRTMRGGFEGWFRFADQANGTPPAVWKQNMVVLLVLYPVVFLFGAWIGTPFLGHKGVPFWLSLFIGNIVSVSMTGFFLISWASRALKWWLAPDKDAPAWITLAGTVLVLALYGVAMAIFARFPSP